MEKGNDDAAGAIDGVARRGERRMQVCVVGAARSSLHFASGRDIPRPARARDGHRCRITWRDASVARGGVGGVAINEMSRQICFPCLLPSSATTAIHSRPTPLCTKQNTTARNATTQEEHTVYRVVDSRVGSVQQQDVASGRYPRDKRVR